MRERKLLMPLLIAAAIGIMTAAASGYFLFFASKPTPQPVVNVPVPSRDLMPFWEIRAEDLMWRTVPVKGIEPGAILDPMKIIGKMAREKLLENQQLKISHLIDAKTANIDKRILSVSVDLVRSVGAMIAPGDTVDVYWLQSPDIPGALLARGAIVISLKDNKGATVDREKRQEEARNALAMALSQQVAEGQVAQQVGAALEGQAAMESLPAIAVLAVLPEEAPQVVRGAFHDNKNIILVKRVGAPGSGEQRRAGDEIEPVPAKDITPPPVDTTTGPHGL